MKFVLRDKTAIDRAIYQITSCKPDPLMEVIIQPYEDIRSSFQNAGLWPSLEDISEQVEWYGQKYTPDDWKDILSAGLKTQRFAPGVEGGMVALGIRTSKMSKREFSELREYIYAFGAMNGVKFRISQ